MTTGSYGDGTSVKSLIRKTEEAGYWSCDPWVGSLACYSLHYRRSQPDRKICFRTIRNQKTVQKSVKRYFGGTVSWEKRPFITCVQQISGSDCTAYKMRIHISPNSFIRVYTYTNQTLQTRRLSRVFLAYRKV